MATADQRDMNMPMLIAGIVQTISVTGGVRAAGISAAALPVR